jgi:hypothetical protein
MVPEYNETNSALRFRGGRCCVLYMNILMRVFALVFFTCSVLSTSVICRMLCFSRDSLEICLPENIVLYEGHAVKVDPTFEEGQDIYTLNTGRILVAYADRYEFDLVVKRWGMPGERWDNINNPEDFERVVEKIRKDGHIVTTVNNEEIVSFSVPVLDSRGRIIYALGSYAPSFRCPDEKRREIITEMKKAAKSIEKMLSMRS